MYLLRSDEGRPKSPTPIRSVLLAVVGDLQLFDSKKLIEVRQVTEDIFGVQVAESIAIDLGRNGEIVVTTTKEIMPLVKLRSSRLATQLADIGIVGEVRIVSATKAP